VTNGAESGHMAEFVDGDTKDDCNAAQWAEQEDACTEGGDGQ